MGITAKRGVVSEKTYTVSGKTLEEINKDMGKKGPTDPNDSKRFSGSCLGQLAIDIKPKDIGFETQSSAKGFAAVARLKGGSVTSSAVITTPKLASDKDLSEAARKEWRRFLVSVGVHESGHADSYHALAVKVTQDLSDMSGAGTGKTENEARAAAGKALYAKISGQYGGTAIADLVKADAKAYDAKNKHGESQGAVLDASVA